MSPDELIDRLQALPIFAEVPRPELAWLVAHGRYQVYEAGQIQGENGEVVTEMFIPLTGRAGLYLSTPGGRRKILEAGAGSVLGALPYSRLQRSPGAVIIEETAEAVIIHQDQFLALTRECPGLTAALVHSMVDRAREFRSVQLNDDRLQSLGRLASGLAHELNNPASAAARHARSLPVWLEEAERAARALAGARLADEQLDVIDSVRSSCTGPAPTRTALEAADREEDIAEWLAKYKLDRTAAEALASSNVTVASLQRLAEAVPGDALGVATRWVSSACAARAVSQHVETSTARIHDLVASIKGFSFMDREGVPEDVDIARGLADTLAMLENKSRAKAVGVQLQTAADLPRVHGFGSELNQLWEKLIDNAIDAAGREGQVDVTAAVRGDSVVVRVSDNGPGIPEEIRPRIFDPFFTTKPVGAGTGLGLYLARRVVQSHLGDLDFTTQPGRTVFRVRLPTRGSTPRPVVFG
jgi:signal transduction histidine kinase